MAWSASAGSWSAWARTTAAQHATCSSATSCFSSGLGTSCSRRWLEPAPARYARSAPAALPSGPRWAQSGTHQPEVSRDRSPGTLQGRQREGHPVASPSVSQAPVSTRLYLVRHCDVRNPKGVLYGHLPDFPLSDKGVAQAHALGRYFAEKKIPQIYSSPLDRARETAEIIASYLDSVPIIYTDDLIETRFGLYLQGVPPKQVPWRRPLWFVQIG